VNGALRLSRPCTETANSISAASGGIAAVPDDPPIESRYAWRTWVLGVGLPVGLTMSIATVYALRGRVIHSLLQAAISVAFSTLVAMGLSYVVGLYFWSREEH
jgi:hypothetical protein